MLPAAMLGQQGTHCQQDSHYHHNSWQYQDVQQVANTYLAAHCSSTRTQQMPLCLKATNQGLLSLQNCDVSVCIYMYATVCWAQCGCNRHSYVAVACWAECIQNRAVVTSQHGCSHGNDIRLHLPHGGPHFRVQRVGVAEQVVGVQQQLQVLLASHVQGSRYFAVALCDGQVLGCLQECATSALVHNFKVCCQKCPITSR